MRGSDGGLRVLVLEGNEWVDRVCHSLAGLVETRISNGNLMVGDS